MSSAFLIGFVRSTIPMLGCLFGLWLFTVRREHCEKKFILCIAAAVVLEFVIYYFMFNGDPDIQGIPLSKILTTLMISFLIFWGGLYVYGGWSKIGIFIFSTDMFLAIVERVYWATWEYYTHGSVDRAMIYYKGDKVVQPDSFPVFVLDCLFLIPFLIGGYKLRSRQLRPAWLFKIAVISYLAIGATPLITRPGFEGEYRHTAILIEMVWAVLLFLIIMTAHITAMRENRRILYIRKQVVEEQSRILMLQKEKVRRLHHDVKKHLSNLEYILEKEPGMRSDPSLLRYQEKLKANEEWMKEGLYCNSSVMNLCFGQIRRYCDDRGIASEIVLKRLGFSGWEQEDQLMFGTLLFNLLQLSDEMLSIAAVRYSGDCMLGQNLLRITMMAGTAGGQDQIQQKDRARKRKYLSGLEKDIRLVLSKYEGSIEQADEGENSVYVINWKDGNVNS